MMMVDPRQPLKENMFPRRSVFIVSQKVLAHNNETRFLLENIDFGGSGSDFNTTLF